MKWRCIPYIRPWKKYGSYMLGMVLFWKFKFWYIKKCFAECNVLSHIHRLLLFELVKQLLFLEMLKANNEVKLSNNTLQYIVIQMIILCYFSCIYTSYNDAWSERNKRDIHHPVVKYILFSTALRIITKCKERK